MRQEFTQEIENTVRAIVNDIHTALPGEIISFDEEKCTVTVQPKGKYVLSSKEKVDYPKIAEVPLVFPYCQKLGVGIAFPVKKGDSCVVIISEVELDEWRSGAKSEGSLRYNLTSAIAIPGLIKGKNDLVEKANKDSALLLAASDTEVAISENEVKISVDTVSFNISEAGITARGDLIVEGNISYTGEVKKAEISENEV